MRKEMMLLMCQEIIWTVPSPVIIRKDQGSSIMNRDKSKVWLPKSQVVSVTLTN